ncbi:hypothetical protein Tco_1284454 [Tanacetum coccineum]
MGWKMPHIETEPETQTETEHKTEAEHVDKSEPKDDDDEEINMDDLSKLCEKRKLEEDKAAAEAANLKAQTSYPNIQQLSELLVSSLQPKLMKLDFPTDILELPNKLNEFTKALFIPTSKVEKLEGFKLEILADLVALPSHMSNTTSQFSQLKVLDIIPDIMSMVVASLDKFLDAISSASQRAGSSSVPSAGLVVTRLVEGEKNTIAPEQERNKPTIAQLFQRRQEKEVEILNKQIIEQIPIIEPITEPIPTSEPITTTTTRLFIQLPFISSLEKTTPQTEQYKDKGKKATSQEYLVVDEEESDNDSHNQSRPSGTIEASSKSKPIKNFTYITESRERHHMTKEDIEKHKIT